jgi:hypothetical protein
MKTTPRQRKRWRNGAEAMPKGVSLMLIDDLDEALSRVERLRVAGEKLLHSLGEYVRQSMHANPEWRDGIEAMEAAQHDETSEANVAGTKPSGSGLQNLASPEIATSAILAPAEAPKGRDFHHPLCRQETIWHCVYGCTVGRFS